MTSDATNIYDWDVELIDQSTQTTEVIANNIVSLTASPRLPLPKDIGGSSEGSVTLFEFCQVLHDPDSPQSVTIIKETTTEPNKFPPYDIGNSSDKDKTASKRYEYCKEVIKPYLKYSPDCPDSNEELLKDAFDDVSDDIPDYQPCDQHNENKNSEATKKTSKSITSSVDKVDVGTSTDMDAKTTEEGNCVIIDTECKKCPSVGECPTVCPTVCPLQKPLCTPPVSACSPPKSDSPCPSGSDPPPEPCEPKSTNPCCQPFDKGLCNKKKKDDAAATAEKKKPCSPKQKKKPHCCETEPTIGVCPKPCGKEDQKNHYVLRKRCKDVDAPSTNSSGQCSSIDKFKESHMKTICTIKSVVENFVEKVADTGKEAISSIITSDSCASDTNSNKPKKCCDHDCKAQLTNRFFQKPDNRSDARREEHGIGIRDEFPKFAEAVDTIVTAVDSTMSSLAECISQSYDSISESFKPSKSDEKGAPLDKPPPPKNVSHAHLFIPDSGAPSNPSGFFSTIKSRLFSIFGNEPVMERPMISVSKPPSHSSSKSSRN